MIYNLSYGLMDFKSTWRPLLYFNMFINHQTVKQNFNSSVESMEDRSGKDL